MIAVFPAGGVLATVLVVWVGTTASVGRHARPGRLARIAARAWARKMGWRVPYPEDEEEDESENRSQQELEELQARLGSLWGRFADPANSIEPEQWRQAMLHARMPHLFSATWLDDQITDHAQWAAGVWAAIRAMKQEAGITE